LPPRRCCGELSLIADEDRIGPFKVSTELSNNNK